MHKRTATIAAGLFFICWSFIALSFLHHQSFSPSLRYTRVAYGNLSKVVYSIWHNGPISYVHMLRYDARGAGRIRPIHWLYYNVPFALTLLRNGDLYRPNGDVPLPDRINGDLQTHTLFLVASLAIAAGLMSWMIWLVSGSLLLSSLFPLYLSQSFSVCENLLVHYCDSQEIPQLLFLACYLFFIRNIFLQRVPKKSQEILASIFLALAYGVKETTVVALPVVGVVLGIQLIKKFDRTRQFKNFCLRHIGLHAFYTVSLLSAVWFFRSGAYVAKNYLIGPNIKAKIDFTINVLTKDMPILPMLIVGGVFGIFCFKTASKKGLFERQNEEISMLSLLLMTIGLFGGFLLINLPWGIKLIKYYLPVVFFAACSIVLLQALVYQNLSYRGLRIAAIIWLIGTSFFMLKNFNSQRLNISHFYQQNYGYRKAVPKISRDIASCAESMHQPLKVLIIAEKTTWRFLEGALPFLRQTNLLYGINISYKGNMIHHIHTIERNFFRIYPQRPSVEIAMHRFLPKKLDFDKIYIFGKMVADTDKIRIAHLGYTLDKIWDARAAGVNIVSFLKPALAQVLPGGLKVSYYAGINFEHLIFKRTERRVDRNYGKENPATGVPQDHFSARWEGYINVPVDDTYYFKLQSDDGSRLYIDDKLIIDNWAGHAFLPKVGQKTLKKGKYPIKIEYFDKVGNARLRLKWNGDLNEIRAGSILAVPFISKH